MPTVSVYIKNDDWEAWRRLEKPSEFIHNALNGMGGSNALDAYLKAGGDPEFVIASKKDLESQFGTKPIKTPKDAEKATKTLEDFGTRYIPKSYSARKKK